MWLLIAQVHVHCFSFTFFFSITYIDMLTSTNSNFTVLGIECRHVIVSSKFDVKSSTLLAFSL